MTSRKRTPAAAPSVGTGTGSTPSQQDAGDILAEVGAVPSEDGNGELEVDEAKIREVGAVDAESVLSNRRGEEIVGKVRSGQKGVLFNLDNILEKYDLTIRSWPPNTIDILVNRMTGSPVQWVIQSRPRSGAELYTLLLAHHGHAEEAEYEVRLIDSTGKQRRGTGRITLPDTRDTPPIPAPAPQGQPAPMSPYYPLPPYGAQPPPPQPQPTVQVVPATVDPVATMEKMFGLFQQMQSSARQQSTGPVNPPSAPPATAPTTDPLAMMEQSFRMFQQMQNPQAGAVAPQPTPAPVPASSTSQSTDPMAMLEQSFRLFQQMQTQAPGQQPQPPTPSSSSDPMAVMEHAFRLFQQMQTQQPQPQPVVVAPQAPSTDPLAVVQQAFEMFRKMQQSAPAPVPQQPTASTAPPINPPPGMIHVPGFGFVPAAKLLQAISGEPAAPAGPGPGYRERPAYGGPRPYYPGPREDGYPPPQQQPPPARTKTAAEEFQDAAGVVEMAINLAKRFQGETVAASEPEERRRPEEDSHTRVENYGTGWPVVINKKDGSPRWGDTVVANTGNVLKWVAEQREAIQRAQAEREKPRPQQRLPPGYVEVTPGYRPPPGYVAIPEELPPQEASQEEELPQPPRHMPPPLTQDEPLRARTQDDLPRRAWGTPPMSGGAQ